MAEITRIRPPGDKSLTHRALLLGALASGSSRIKSPLVAGDTRSLAAVLRKLGVSISALDHEARVEVRGVGLDGLRTPSAVLDCGNSGTAARLLIGVIAGSQVTAELTGDDSLRARPMRRVLEPLRQMGADFVEKNGDGLPLVVRGRRLSPYEHRLTVASAQVKSALLLAGLVSHVKVSVAEVTRTRDHTERMLAALGAPLQTLDDRVSLDVIDELSSFTFTVPGDPSSAAFLIAAAILTPGRAVMVERVGINPTRTAFIDVLRRMGAQIDVRQVDEALGEPVGDILVTPGPLEGVAIGPEGMPWMIDEIPILAVLASRARGETVFRGVGELRVKESDRLMALHANLRAVGGDARVEGDVLIVRGRDRSYGGVVDTRQDHRIAMAFATLSVSERSDLQLSEHHSPRISYPDFFSDLQRIAQRG